MAHDPGDHFRPGEAEAVEAVMAAMGEWPNGNPYRKIMTEAIGLAYPVIEAVGYKRGREQAAQDIEAYGDRHGTHSNGEPDDDWTRGVYDAAEIMRGWPVSDWRIGRRYYGYRVYEGDRPVANFREEEDALRAVEAVNGAASVGRLSVNDLDRCEHGRHVNDLCFGCRRDFGEENVGNPHLDDVVGFHIGGRVFTVRDLLKEIGRTGER